ncbi:MAG: DUF1080 domain-containing protein [Bacteroidia bacterium]
MIFGFWCGTATLATAQEWDRAKMDPRATELWEPIPPVVTPGNYHTPPSDAIVLFDGKDLSNWVSMDGSPAKWTVQDGAMTVLPQSGNIQTRMGFGDIQLHLEWRSPVVVKGEGQGRGNSGVFLMGTYEVQVLDCYDNRTYSNGQTASVYKQVIPLANACRPPGEWQTYDIIFMAPVFDKDGSLRRPATVTVIHNGIVVQNHVEIRGDTPYQGLPEYRAHADELPLQLQDHGDLVSYRNIWVRKL